MAKLIIGKGRSYCKSQLGKESIIHIGHYCAHSTKSLIQTLNHENLHDILGRVISPIASSQFDNIDLNESVFGRLKRLFR